MLEIILDSSSSLLIEAAQTNPEFTNMAILTSWLALRGPLSAFRGWNDRNPAHLARIYMGSGAVYSNLQSWCLCGNCFNN